MGLSEEIFRYLDDGDVTLVFPTENAARHWLSMYVRQRRTSVLADRAIALDSFKQMFAPVHDQKPANKYHRLVFISSLLSSGASGLHYLYSDQYSSYRRRFIPFLMRVLPGLMQLDQIPIRGKSLFSDLQILKRQYAAFLDEHGLFEPGWENHSIKNYKGETLNHVLVGYDCDIQMQRFMAEMGQINGVGTLCLGEVEKPLYHQYMTEEAELEDLFSRLQSLKEDGVLTSDIIISTPALDSIRARLERKANEYNIPLSFMGSLNLFETVPGRYLDAISQCITERLTFRSMENLLLNSSFPYMDMETNRKLIRFMIDRNIQSGSLDMRADPLFSALQKSNEVQALDLYRKIKGSLNAIRKACGVESLSRDLHVLTSSLFGPEEFNAGCAEDRDVYSFIVSELSDLGRTMSELCLDMGDLFSVFMDSVGSLSYVPQDERAGIRVYRYAQDQLLRVKWHFIIGLSDANAQVRESELGFLEEHEVVSRPTYDVTERLMDYYGQSGDEVFISGSKESFEGSAGAPSVFIMDDRVVELLPVFTDVFEKADQISLNQAGKTSLAPAGENLAKSGVGFMRDPDKRPLSYSSISNYIKCPYMSFVEEVFFKDAPDHFEPAKQDDMKLGSFLHNVIQAFMQKHIGSLVVPERLASYQDEVEQIMDRMLSENDMFDPYTKKCIRGNYLEPLKSALKIMLIPPASSRTKGYIGPFRPLVNEFKLDGNHSFIGYIDTIIMDLSGKIHLLDYKKGNISASYQLILYRRLYDDKAQFGSDVGQCLFYAMGTSSFKGYDDSKWAEQSEKLDKDIECVREGYFKGLWNATPSKSNCQRCKERTVCRRRFNLQ